MKSSKTILMVDDNRVVLKLTANKLRSFGYEVHTAEDGGGAIAKLREVRPDLLLLDLNFPPDVAHGGGVPWDGLLLLSWLRRMNEAENMQVIAITGGDLPHYKDRCLEAGVLDIFLKPIDIEALVATIRRALREAPRVQEPATPTARLDYKLERKPDAQAAKPHLPPATRIEGPGHRRLEPEVRPEPRSTFQPEPNPEAESGCSKRILFVDDESDWRYMGELYLKECGYEVTTTADAVGALAQAATQTPDLVVLDLNLGGQSDVTLLKLLAQAHPKTPIVIYTGKELDEKEVSKLLDDGAFECLRKGTMEELLNAVARALGHAAEEVGVVARAACNPAVFGPAREEVAQESFTASERAVEAVPEGTEAVTEPYGGSAPETVELRDQSVLAVTENAELGDTLRAFLEPRSFNVTCMIDGTEALSRIRTAEVDLIIFDMLLSSPPVNDFYRALEGIKPELRQRMIFITSDDVHPTLDGFVRRVRGRTLWQPFTSEELLEAVQAIGKQEFTASQK